MSISLSRRAFIARLTIVALSPAIRRQRVLRIGVDGSGASDQRAMGLELGADEAKHAGALFGATIELVPAHAGGLSAVIGGRELCASTEMRGVPSINVSCSADTLRHRCDALLFHVAPSDAMKRDALAGRQGEVVSWHASLTRFGADTLNQRFLTRFKQPMSEDAWTAWFAVKVLWEASLRTRSVEPAAIAKFLSDDATQFDGHKGRPLSFRAWDRQLRQPLYVVNGARVLEVPAAAPADVSTRAVLDKLGEREGSCAH